MPGLDPAVLKVVDPNLALKRISHDIHTDFIWAPHLESIFRFCGDALWDQVKRSLSSGTYEPDRPISIDVPKQYGFTRPGSILSPGDRLVYQVLADLCASTVEQQMDRTKVFSNILNSRDASGAMFMPHGDGWRQMQLRLAELANRGGYFITGDIAHYFERIPQHHLINLLRASGVGPAVIGLLEEVFLAFQERDSFGIIQGVYPSDMFGNFYLSDLDAQCELKRWESLRFVDDFYIHFDSRRTAERGLSQIIAALRRDGLHLNENKSGIRDAADVVIEETELDRLLNEAREEISAERGTIEFEYGFTTDWEPEPDEETLQVTAIERIYENIDEYPKAADKIEKFCLPFLRAAKSTVAIERSLAGIRDRPHLSRLYLSYLSELARSNSEVSVNIQAILIQNDLVFDYQKLFLLSALLNACAIQRDCVVKAVRLLEDPNVHVSVRAIAAIFASRHGSPQHRRAVRTSYENEPSPYVQAAILYSSIYFTSTEKKTCIKAWGGHNSTNALVAEAIRQIQT